MLNLFTQKIENLPSVALWLREQKPATRQIIQRDNLIYAGDCVIFHAQHSAYRAEVVATNVGTERALVEFYDAANMKWIRVWVDGGNLELIQ